MYVDCDRRRGPVSCSVDPVLNSDRSQAISGADCERYVAHLRTLTDGQLASEMEKWQGFIRSRVTP